MLILQHCINKKRKVGDIHQFNLTHGSFFVLHPQDEVTMVRSLYGRYGKTFFNHSSNGVKSEGEGLFFVLQHVVVKWR